MQQMATGYVHTTKNIKIIYFRRSRGVKLLFLFVKI